jgi:hypothetical protein
MELMARVLITIPDEEWKEWVEEEKASDIQYRFGKDIQAALTPYPGGYPRAFDWKTAEFIEWEES